VNGREDVRTEDEIPDRSGHGTDDFAPALRLVVGEAGICLA